MSSKKRCSKQNTANFKRRKSPPYKSSDCKGRKMKGNDGDMWESIQRKDGVYTWKITYKNPETDERKIVVGHVTLLR